MRLRYDAMLELKARELLAGAAIVAPGDSVLVAFSGGPDSTALLHLLNAMRDELGCRISAAHLNHKLRGKAGDADERWCADMAQQLGIPFRSSSVDVAEEARRGGGNLEETARECRYKFLDRVAAELGADRIALGHTADDQVETVLLRLARGAALTGLRGMRAIRGRYIRPLLTTTREEVLAYLQHHGVGYRADASNEDERFSRVLVRRRMMPLLRRLNPSVAQTVAGACAIIGDEDEFLNEVAEEIIGRIGAGEGDRARLKAPEIEALHPALQRRVLRRFVAGRCGSLRGLSLAAVEAMRRCCAGNGPAVELPGNRTFALREGVVFIYAKEENGAGNYHHTLRVGETLTVREVDKTFTLTIIDDSNSINVKESSGPKRAFLDADAAGAELEVRSRQPGDRYRPLGAPGRQKLHDMFINAKVEREARDRSPVFLSRGRICWAGGLRVAHDFRVTSRTKRVLKIEEVDR